MANSGKYNSAAVGFVVGASIATIVGVSAHGGDSTRIHACVNDAGGLRIVAAAESCKLNETPLDWSVQGAKGDTGLQGPKGDQGEPGPPGTFAGVFTSPNAAYTLSVTDTGIQMAGPEGVIRITSNGVELAGTLSKINLGNGGLTLDSQTALRLKSAVTLTAESTATEVKGTALLDLNGGIVLVNGTPVP